jgi:hypothetical protein
LSATDGVPAPVVKRVTVTTSSSPADVLAQEHACVVAAPDVPSADVWAIGTYPMGYAAATVS